MGSRCKQKHATLPDKKHGGWGKNVNHTVLISMGKWVWTSSLKIYSVAFLCLVDIFENFNTFSIFEFLENVTTCLSIIEVSIKLVFNLPKKIYERYLLYNFKANVRFFKLLYNFKTNVHFSNCKCCRIFLGNSHHKCIIIM